MPVWRLEVEVFREGIYGFFGGILQIFDGKKYLCILHFAYVVVGDEA